MAEPMTVAANSATLGTAAPVHQEDQSLQELQAILTSSRQGLQCCRVITVRRERPPEKHQTNAKVMKLPVFKNRHQKRSAEPSAASNRSTRVQIHSKRIEFDQTFDSRKGRVEARLVMHQKLEPLTYKQSRRRS